MRSRLPIALCWAAGASLRAGATCETRGSRCICEDDTGELWDLTSLGTSDAHKTDGPGASVDWIYSFKFCEDIVPVEEPCPGYGIVSSRAYRISDTASLQTCQQLGPGQGVASGMTPIALSNGLSLRYLWLTNGLTVNLVCDESKRGQTTTPERAAGTGLGTVEWYTYVACPAFQAGGLSVGWMIITFSSVAAALYLGGGVAYNRKQGHSGLENLVPQYEAWSELPGLVGDGVHFSRTALSENIAACSCLAPPGEYDEIGGQRKRKKEKKEKKEKKKEKKGKKGKVPPPPPEEEPLAPKPKPKPKPTMSYSEMLSAAPRMAIGGHVAEKSDEI